MHLWHLEECTLFALLVECLLHKLSLFPDPRLVEFVRSRKAQHASSSASSSVEKSVCCPDQSFPETKDPAPHHSDSKHDSHEITMDTDEEHDTKPNNHHPITGK